MTGRHEPGDEKKTTRRKSCTTRDIIATGNATERGTSNCLKGETVKEVTNGGINTISEILTPKQGMLTQKW